MSFYRKIWGWVVLGLGAYMAVGFATFDISSKKSREIFPIFSWFLFAEVPQKTHVRYTLRVYRVDEKSLPEPLLFSEARAYSNPQSVSANKLIQDMGKAIESHDEAGLQKARQVLESNQIHRFQTYELIKLTYDPVERYQTGRMKMETVRFFEKGKE